MALSGLVLITPTSTAKTGASSTATINTNGSVTFSSCATLSLNGVFTSSYDNYMITMRVQSSAGNDAALIRLRTAGTDASGANYTQQYILASGTSATASRTASATYAVAGNADAGREGFAVYVFGPNLAQPTAFRSVTISSESSARIVDYACTHSLSTAYDSFSFITLGATLTGLVTVFGFNQ